jgi:hypothetical protein
MTHEYTILLGGLVLRAVSQGDGRPIEPPPSAIAWAHDTILAIGDDRAVRAISRGDSTFIDLAGRAVIPLDGRALEVGGPADLLVLDGTDAGAGGSEPPGDRIIATIRSGRFVDGRLSSIRPIETPVSRARPGRRSGLPRP